MDSRNPTLKPAEVAALIVDQCVFLAGVMLSFGGLLDDVISGGAAGLTASNPGIVKVLGGFVFPVGLVMWYFPMAVVKRAIPWWSLPVNWIIVTFGNLVGSFLTWLYACDIDSGIVSVAPYNDYIVAFALKKAAEPEWHQIFLRGIGCNWLVCIAVWQAAGARDTISKIFAIWIPIWIFVACSYDHVVANMFSVPLGIMFGADLTVADYIKKSLIASYIGNIIGALFVGMPATYFYLRDYNAGGLREAESGSAADSVEVTDLRKTS
ncbi:Formate/nitrite transporter [Rhodocollybia butyracea]|uniref:Formate/nitrite transporter n=1 Tax=Rhodocollybia butyracea TaxID=206335 RepID=A0A9P5PX15_9AGAR|nr:Formate/nitrite transporter [Rhodocollybia butyracea]